MISLALKNIKNSFSAYRNIYALLLLSQFIGIIILLFVYGTITSYNIKIEDNNTRYNFINVKFADGVSAEVVKEILPEILPQMESRLKYCFADFVREDTELEVTAFMSYKDGKYSVPETSFPRDRLVVGRYPTDIEMTEGEAVAFAYGGQMGAEVTSYKWGDKYSFKGKQYEIVGVVDGLRNISRITIPINSCTADMKVKLLRFEFNGFVTEKDHKLIEDTLKSSFGKSCEFSEFELVELDDIVRFNTVILLAVIIGGIVAFDTVLVYSYILEKRKRQMAILSIVGANRFQRVVICGFEILFITVLTTIIGAILFEFVLKNIIIKIYVPSIEMYTLKTYLYIVISYIGTIVFGTSVVINISTKKRVLATKGV